MSFFYKISVFQKAEVGSVILARKRLLFRILTPFSKNNFIMAFQPNLSGAKWHRLSTEWEDEEMDTLMEQENALSAMAFLRTNNKLVAE